MFAGITVPLAGVRLRTGFGRTQRHLSAATFAVEFLYSLSGALNVLLFLFTRSDLLLPRNVSSDKVLATALGDETIESKTEFGDFAASRPQARQRSRGYEPVPLGLLPGTDDDGWHLPGAGHDGNESV